MLGACPIQRERLVYIAKGKCLLTQHRTIVSGNKVRWWIAIRESGCTVMERKWIMATVIFCTKDASCALNSDAHRQMLFLFHVPPVSSLSWMTAGCFIRDSMSASTFFLLGIYSCKKDQLSNQRLHLSRRELPNSSILEEERKLFIFLRSVRWINYCPKIKSLKALNTLLAAKMSLWMLG